MNGQAIIATAILFIFLLKPITRVSSLPIPFPQMNSLSINQLEQRAQAYYDEGRYNQSLFYAQNAFTLDPKSTSLATNLGSISDELGDYNSSIAFYKKALSIDHRHISALVGMGSVLAHLYSTKYDIFQRGCCYTEVLLRKA